MERVSAEDLREYDGCLCELMTEDSRLLTVGVLRLTGPGEFQVVSERSTSVPQGVVFQTEVKARVYAGAGGSRVVMMYGQVTGTGEQFFRIEVQNLIVCLERREAFRQPISVSARVYRLREGQIQRPGAECRLLDISMTGVRIQCAERYEAGDELFLEAVRLLNGGPRHNLTCRVVRCQPPSGEEARFWQYGCGFWGLRVWQEDQLCRDILALQAKTMRSAADS